MSEEILTKMGNPVLRDVASLLSTTEIGSEDTRQLLELMESIREEKGGIGIAAPQIGVSKQVCLIKMNDKNERYPAAKASESWVLFNPKVTVLTEEIQGFFEGCLSLPGLRGYVERPKKIEVTYLDTQAREQTLICEGFLATVFQHEIDHLNGILYIDHLKDMKLLAFEEEYLKYLTKNI